MAKASKFIARYNGEIVGKRSSTSRTYTHAIVAQVSEQYCRDAAYNYAGSKFDRHQFEHAALVATKQPGDVLSYTAFGDRRPFNITLDADRIARAIEDAEGGWEGYEARLRAKAIASFEQDLARNAFRPHVVQWSMSLRNAQKGSGQFNGTARKVLAIVPAEQV